MFPDLSGVAKVCSNPRTFIRTQSAHFIRFRINSLWTRDAARPDQDILISVYNYSGFKNLLHKKKKKKIGYQNVPRIRYECEKSLVTNCSLSEVSTAKWLSYFRIERRSTMSCHHGSKISGSEQSFLTETAICIVERCKISMDYCFVFDCNHERKVMNLNFFVFFVRHICRATVC